LFFAPAPAYSSGVPVVDVVNFVQNTITAIEAVSQTANQLQAYRAQLKQLEDQIRNTSTPSTYLWSEAEMTMRNIRRLQWQLSDIYLTVGSLDAYLNNFRGLDYYRGQMNNPHATRDDILRSEEWAMTEKRQEHERTMRALDARQTALQKDSAMLDQLSRRAGAAEGRMEALQYANQFASLQNAQLLQMRGVVETMQLAAVTREMAEQDIAARGKAADEAALVRKIGKFDEMQLLGLPGR
jgi:P-type conjugative transfer protein TrbJ